MELWGPKYTPPPHGETTSEGPTWVSLNLGPALHTHASETCLAWAALGRLWSSLQLSSQECLPWLQIWPTWSRTSHEPCCILFATMIYLSLYIYIYEYLYSYHSPAAFHSTRLPMVPTSSAWFRRMLHLGAQACAAAQPRSRFVHA